MNNELAFPAPPSQDVIKVLTASNKPVFSFLNIAQPLSKVITDPKSLNLIRPGQFFLSAKDVTECVPLGGYEKDGASVFWTVKCCCGPVRPKAIRLINNTQVDLESYDMNSSDFKTIMFGKDIPNKVTHMFGLEQLFYIPQEEIHKDFQEAYPEGVVAVFFFKKTAKPYAKPDLLGKSIVFMTEFVSYKNQSWWSPSKSRLITPAPKWADGNESPAFKQILNVAQQFANPTGGQPVDASTVER